MRSFELIGESKRGNVMGPLEAEYRVLLDVNSPMERRSDHGRARASLIRTTSSILRGRSKQERWGLGSGMFFRTTPPSLIT
jgi:hypothetical protein